MSLIIIHRTKIELCAGGKTKVMRWIEKNQFSPLFTVSRDKNSQWFYLFFFFSFCVCVANSMADSLCCPPFDVAASCRNSMKRIICKYSPLILYMCSTLLNSIPKTTFERIERQSFIIVFEHASFDLRNEKYFYGIFTLHLINSCIAKPVESEKWRRRRRSGRGGDTEYCQCSLRYAFLRARKRKTNNFLFFIVHARIFGKIDTNKFWSGDFKLNYVLYLAKINLINLFKMRTHIEPTKMMFHSDFKMKPIEEKNGKTKQKFVVVICLLVCVYVYSLIKSFSIESWKGLFTMDQFIELL